MALGPVMLDIEGTALTPADRELLRQPAVGGVILFSRNFSELAQLVDLVKDIRALRNPSLLVAVDHEGGRVQRFRDEFSPVPPMRRLGNLHRGKPEDAIALARDCGWLIGAELRACGIDLCFAPCLDLDWGVSDIIGDRSFHRSPDVVAELAMSFSQGLRAAGMSAVGKHFPGHGAVVADSHESLPTDRRSYADILDDIRPYERLVSNSVLAGVMTAHIVYQEVDRLPATFSTAWLTQELRGRLGFNGAIFSDDLSMKATRTYGSMASRARQALEAGCDMLLVCNDRSAAESAVESLSSYSSPISLVRLARLHGTGDELWESLHAGDSWQSARERLDHFLERPALELDA
ncbi:MAG: beta-N-acetylhexosaminidase [Pseudomonadota bacterium]